MEDNSNKQDIFINGREQAIEILRRLDPNHRDLLLRNIRLRNPNVASELEEKSSSFEDLLSVNDRILSTVLSHVDAKIIGLSIANCSEALQRKFLNLISRSDAEVAFGIMTNLDPESRHLCQKAQNKILGLARRMAA